MNIFTISIVEIIMRVYTRVRFFVWKVLWTEGANWRCSTIPVKEFILSKIAGLQPATLLKIEFFRRYFSRVLIIVVEHLLCRTPLNGCFCMEKLQLFIYVFVLLYIYGTFNKRWKVAECTLYVAAFSLTTMLV